MVGDFVNIRGHRVPTESSVYPWCLCELFQTEQDG